MARRLVQLKLRLLRNALHASTAAQVSFLVSTTLAILVAIGPLLLVAGRFRQARRERGFDDSLRGDLSRAIAQIGHQTAIFGSISWWYLFPMFCGALVFLIVVCVLESQPESLIIAGIVMSAAGVLSYWVNRRYIRKRLLPRLRALETLRAKLIDSED